MSDIDKTQPVQLTPRTRSRGKHHQRELIGIGAQGHDRLWHQVLVKYDMYITDDSPQVCHPEVQVKMRDVEFACEVFCACGVFGFLYPAAGVPVFTDVEPGDLCGFCWIGLRP